MAASIDEILEYLSKIDAHHIAYELKVLRAIRQWAIAQCCDFAEGDRVEMATTLALDKSNGWYANREMLEPGATGIAKGIDFNEHYGYWYADVVFDREWSTAEWGTGTRRYWKGPIDETPEGYEAPSSYDQEHYPQGRKHTFAIPVKYLRRADESKLQAVSWA